MRIGLRDILKIGKPSNRYYQFIHPSLDFKNHQLEDLAKLRKIKDAIVTVSSILTMKGGRLVAVLRRNDGKNYQNRLERVFADVNESLRAKELLPLSLEELRMLKDNSND